MSKFERNFEIDLDKNFSLGDTGKRFRITYSNLPIIEDFYVDTKINLMQYIDNYVIGFTFPDLSIDNVMDRTFFSNNIVPIPHQDTPSNGDNNIQLEYTIDEYYNNYMLFLEYMWLIQYRGYEDDEGSFHKVGWEKLFIHNITIDFLTNIGNPKVVHSIIFENCVLERVSSIKLEDKENITFNVNFTYERMTRNFTKQKVIEDMFKNTGK